MSTQRALGALLSLILVGVFLASTIMCVIFVILFSPFWWIGVSSTLTLLLLSGLAAIGFIGGDTK